jgi:hypothetical protein
MDEERHDAMSEHRVPMLGAALRRRVDPARSSDPRVRELVTALAGLEVAPPPAADFRAELRAQLVAVTPRLVEEGERSGPASTRIDPGAATARSPERDRRPVRRPVRLVKPLIAAACVLGAFVLLLGGAVLLSQHALPGDALYGLKRASENTEYGLTGGAVDKGKLKLDFAARRIGEVGDLLPSAGAMAPGVGAVADSGQISDRTSSLVRTTLGSADDDIRSAAQLLGGAAVRGNDPGPLKAVIGWAPGQLEAMRSITARIPAGSLHDRAVQTLSLVKAADQRAATLRTELGCSCLGSTGTDALGPLPCSTGCTSARPGTGTPTPSGSHAPSAPASTKPGRTSTAPGTGGPTGKQPPARGAPTGAPSGSTAPGTTTTPTPSVPLGGVTSSAPQLPGLPGLSDSSKGTSILPSVPLSVNSCGISANLGPIGVGVGGC